ARHARLPASRPVRGRGGAGPCAHEQETCQLSAWSGSVTVGLGPTRHWAAPAQAATAHLRPDPETGSKSCAVALLLGGERVPTGTPLEAGTPRRLASGQPAEDSMLGRVAPRQDLLHDWAVAGGGWRWLAAKSGSSARSACHCASC